jgi:hypothetical protein
MRNSSIFVLPLLLLLGCTSQELVQEVSEPMVIEAESSELNNFIDEIEDNFDSLEFLRSDNVIEWSLDYGQNEVEIAAKEISAVKLTLEQWQGVHEFFIEKGFEEDLSNIVDGTTVAGTGYKNGPLLCIVVGGFPEVEDQDDTMEWEIDVVISCGFRDVKISETQREFLDLRGNPGIFVILFSDIEFNEQGRLMKRETPLRADLWTFGNPDNVTTTFENGFFVEEEEIDGEIEFLAHSISPLDFTYSSNIDDVEALLGKTDCMEEVEAGPNTITTLKYEEKLDTPLVSVSFSDDQIIAVSVGLAFTENDNEKLCN